MFDRTHTLYMEISSFHWNVILFLIAIFYNSRQSNRYNRIIKRKVNRRTANILNTVRTKLMESIFYPQYCQNQIDSIFYLFPDYPQKYSQRSIKS